LHIFGHSLASGSPECSRGGSCTNLRKCRHVIRSPSIVNQDSSACFHMYRTKKSKTKLHQPRHVHTSTVYISATILHVSAVKILLKIISYMLLHLNGQMRGLLKKNPSHGTRKFRLHSLKRELTKSRVNFFLLNQHRSCNPLCNQT
jgi:hypothetical protein